MLIAASVFTTNSQRLRERWKLEAGLPAVAGQKVNTTLTSGAQASSTPLTWTKDEYVFLDPSNLGPSLVPDMNYAGAFVVYDWETKEIAWQADWGYLLGNPAGICFADGQLYVSDFEASNIFEIDVDNEPGKLLKRISHPYFNDLHSLERTSRGLLSASCGTDLVIETDRDGNLLWEWWASEHGYSLTPSGVERPSGRDGEHRDKYYHTRFQSTHLNCAAVRDPEERYILCLLFHQGQLIQIDRSLPPDQQKGELILDGLARPHALEKVPGGWLLANTLGKELILLDDDLKVKEKIFYDGGWIQDCTRMPNGHLLLNDVDNHCLVELAGPESWQIVSKVEYPEAWRMGELVVVPAQHEQAFLAQTAKV